jgi:hypothetical protein
VQGPDGNENPALGQQRQQGRQHSPVPRPDSLVEKILPGFGWQFGKLLVHPGLQGP